MPMSAIAVVNGDLRTMVEGDRRGPRAIGIKNGRIEIVGTVDEVLSRLPDGAEVIDAEGHTVLPGFIDAHCHWGLAAKTYAISSYVGLPEVQSIDELIEAGRRAAAAAAAGDWVLLQGSAFQELYIRERRTPTRSDLDAISTRHPVLYRTALHTVVLNRRALEVAGITADTAPPPGAHIELDPETGEPSGVMHEMWGHLPLPNATEDQMRAQLIRIAEAHLLGNGVTTIHEIWDSPEILLMQAELIRSRRIPLRLEAFGWSGLAGTTAEIAAGATVNDCEEADWLTLGGVKLFADGGTSARTAALFEDYTDDPGNRGILNLSDDELRRELTIARDAGVKIMVHAAGDRAYDQLLRAAEAIGHTPEDEPLRIEHGGNHSWNEDFAERCRKFGVLPVPNVSFIGTYGEMWPGSLGPVRTANMVPLRSMLDQGFPVPDTSDTTGSALAQLNPLLNIWRAVTRKSFGGQPVSPAEAISLDEALVMATRNGARTAGNLDRGVLKPGLLGDVIVLSHDLTDIDVDALPEVAVTHTIVGGRRV